MTQRSDETVTKTKTEIAQIANDLEAANATVIALMKIAERNLAADEPGVETLVQVAGRYAADITKITQRLLDLNRA